MFCYSVCGVGPHAWGSIRRDVERDHQLS